MHGALFDREAHRLEPRQQSLADHGHGEGAPVLQSPDMQTGQGEPAGHAVGHVDAHVRIPCDGHLARNQRHDGHQRLRQVPLPEVPRRLGRQGQGPPVQLSLRRRERTGEGVPGAQLPRGQDKVLMQRQLCCQRRGPRPGRFPVAGAQGGAASPRAPAGALGPLRWERMGARAAGRSGGPAAHSSREAARRSPRDHARMPARSAEAAPERIPDPARLAKPPPPFFSWEKKGKGGGGVRLRQVRMALRCRIASSPLPSPRVFDLGIGVPRAVGGPKAEDGAESGGQLRG
mmetsp:Transcript_10554/g.24976  ORF Transcript_10554/g.24976 Transcript_10554/m.24976 type:complete len:288 (+) Transcript_10554:1844-2707(+)